jgi:hypothetical protein
MLDCRYLMPAYVCICEYAQVAVERPLILQEMPLMVLACMLYGLVITMVAITSRDNKDGTRLSSLTVGTIVYAGVMATAYQGIPALYDSESARNAALCVHACYIISQVPGHDRATTRPPAERMDDSHYHAT